MTAAQIAGANTKGLQAIYLQLFGVPTKNRNAQALRKRLTTTLDKLKSESANKRKKAVPELVPIAQYEQRANAPKRGATKEKKRQNTKAVLARLQVGQVLKHRYTKPEVRECEVKVLAVPGKDGKGGKYEYKGEHFDKLRPIVLRDSGHGWNVLLFFRLRDYYPHKKREPKKE